MKGLNLLFKDKLTIIIAALLIVTLIVCIPFVPMSAKYTTTSESEFNFKLASGVPVLRLGVNDKGTLQRLTFRQALGEIFMKYYPDAGYENWGSPLDEIYYINFVKEENLPADKGERIASGNNTVTESGVVDVYWNANTKTVTVSAAGTIYANPICQELFKGNDEKNKNTEIVDYGISNLRKVGFDNLDTTKVTKITGMFNGCTYLEGFNFADFNTDSVIQMSAVFQNCKKIETVGGAGCNIDISKINTSSNQSFESLFLGCTGLTSIDFSAMTTTTSELNNTKYMFDGCTNLQEIILPVNFSTVKVTDMRNMFNNCSSLLELDLRHLSTSAVTIGFQRMFNGCSSLTKLDISNFDMRYAFQFDYMFGGCSALETIDFGSDCITGSLSARSDAAFEYMFTGCSKLASLEDLQLDLSKHSRSLKGMFNGCSSLVAITFSQGSKAATAILEMFAGCSKLTTLNLGDFDFSKVSTDYNQYYKLFTGHTADNPLTVYYPTADGAWPARLEYNGADGTTKYEGVTFLPAS